MDRQPLPPIPPPLPPGRVVLLPGRGETFVRESPGRPGDPTIVLLHGWTASADLNWWRVYESVAALGHLIAVDHRGHGRGIRTDETFTLEDAADDVAALLEQLEVGPAIVVGYSMGGPISLLVWNRHRHLVSGLVLEATALEWRASRRERLVWKFMAVVEWVLRSGIHRGLVDRGLRKAITVSPDLHPFEGWFKGELRRADPGALAEAGRALGEYDARPFASEVDVPTAVVVTTRDRLVRPKKQRRLASAIPGARLFELPGDHDAALVLPDPFRTVTEAALRAVVDAVRASETSASSA